METYSNILAWEIPWVEEPGGLQSMGSGIQTQEQVSGPTAPSGLRTVPSHAFRVSLQSRPPSNKTLRQS